MSRRFERIRCFRSRLSTVQGLASRLETRRFVVFYCCSATLGCALQTREKLKLSRSMFLFLLAFLLSSHSPNSSFCSYSTRLQSPLYDLTSPQTPPVASSLNVIASSPFALSLTSPPLHSESMATQSNYSTASPTATPSFGNLSDPPTTLKLLVIGKLPTFYSLRWYGRDRQDSQM